MDFSLWYPYVNWIVGENLKIQKQNKNKLEQK